MSDAPGHLCNLSAADRERCEQIASAFDDSWQRSPDQPPNIAGYLPSGEPLSYAVLVALVEIDIEQRLKQANVARVEDYLQSFPRLTADREVVRSLIHLEAHQRRRHEPEIAIDEYEQRFPEFAGELQIQESSPKGAGAQPTESRSASCDAGAAASPNDSSEPERQGVVAEIERLLPSEVGTPPGGRTPASDPYATGNPDPVPHSSEDEWPTIAGYEILEELGRGGMGHVFKARELRLNRSVALKIIRKDRLAQPGAVRRFHREARASARLSHPNIVTLYRADHSQNMHYLAMEYVEGTDLARLVRDKGPFPIAAACDYVRQACLGLQHAHERGLVHRDIKPPNLMLTPQGVVKILDLGLARLVRLSPDDGSSEDLTGLGALMGTPDYLAPEQASDAQKADIRADLYSLGCTLYFLLTGKPPFSGGSFADKVVKHAVEQATPLGSLRAGLPAGLKHVVERLLAKRPDDRFQTPAEVATALEPFTQPEAPPSVDERTPAVANRGRALGVGSSIPPTLPRLALALRIRSLGCSVTLGALLIAVTFGGFSIWDRLSFTSPEPTVLSEGQRTEPQTPSPIPSPRAGSWPATASGIKRTTPPEELVARAIRNGNRELSENKSQDAQKSFQDALSTLREYSLKDDRAKREAEFGRVRAWGLARQWVPLRDYLHFLISPDTPKQDERAFLWAWEALAAEGMNPEDLDGMLRWLVKLKEPEDSFPRLEEWEQKQVRAVTGRVIGRIVSRATETIKNLPATVATLDSVLQTVQQLTRLDPSKGKLLVELRQQAGIRLCDAAKGLRVPFNPERPFDRPFKNVGDAKNVLAWLRKASEMAPDSAAELRKDQGLASWQIQKKNNVDAAEWLKDFKPDNARDSVVYLLAKAEVQPDEDEAGVKIAFTAYEELWKRVGQDGKIAAKQGRYSRVLVPGIERGKKALANESGNELKVRLANLYVAEAEFIEGDMKVHLADWPSGQSQIVEAYKEAVALSNDAKANIYLNEYYLAQSKKDYDSAREGETDPTPGLVKALDEAKNAGKYQGKVPEESLLAEGLALEDLGWLNNPNGNFEEAVRFIAEALHKAKGKGIYQFYLGRCYYKAAIRQAKWDLIEKAQKNLKAAVGEDLPRDLKMAGSFWLALTYYFPKDKPDYDSAKQFLAEVRKWGEGEKGLNKAFGFDALEALRRMAEHVVLKANGTPNVHLKAAAELYEAMLRFARNESLTRLGKSENNEPVDPAWSSNLEEAWFLSANRLVWIGDVYQQKGDAAEAMRIYRSGLPEKIKETNIAESRLLSAFIRVQVCKPYLQYLEMHNQPRPDARLLVEQAEFARNLALESDHKWNTFGKLEACWTSAECLYFAGEETKARAQLQEALKLPEPAAEADRKVFQELKKNMQHLLDQWNRKRNQDRSS
jgi:serine/threonine protein kinase